MTAKENVELPNLTKENFFPADFSLIKALLSIFFQAHTAHNMQLVVTSIMGTLEHGQNQLSSNVNFVLFIQVYALFIALLSISPKTTLDQDDLAALDNFS